MPPAAQVHQPEVRADGHVGAPREPLPLHGQAVRPPIHGPRSRR